MESIVANMDGTTSEDMDAQREKKLDEDKRLIDETNQKMEENEDELLEIPRRIRDVNRKLMLQSMGYFYEKIRVNKRNPMILMPGSIRFVWILKKISSVSRTGISTIVRFMRICTIYSGHPLWICSIFTMKMKMWKRTAHKITKRYERITKGRGELEILRYLVSGKRNEASGSEYIAGVSCTGTGIDGTGIDGFCAEAFSA